MSDKKKVLSRKNISRETLENNLTKTDVAMVAVEEGVRSNQSIEILISDIDSPKYHDRRYIDRYSIVELSESISSVGLLYPIVVRVVNGRYERMIGFRRIEAYKILKKETIQAIVLENISDELAVLIMATENLQREDLSIYDETLALIDYIAIAVGDSQAEVIKLLNRIKNFTSGNTLLTDKDKDDYDAVEILLKKTGKITINTLVNRLSMLNMQELIKNELSSGKLSFSCAQALNKIKDDVTLSLAIEKTISLSLSKRETQALVKSLIPKKEDKSENSKTLNMFMKIKEASILKLDEENLDKVNDLMNKIIEIIEK